MNAKSPTATVLAQRPISRRGLVLGGLATLAGATLLSPSPPAQAAPWRKTPIAGLTDRKGLPSNTGANFAVIDIGWNQLQPDNATQFALGKIDTAINNAQDRGAQSFVLRIKGGVKAPGWLKNSAGQFVIWDTQMTGVKHQCARFWSPTYQAAAKRLDEALAEKYDGDTLVREHTFWANGSVYSPEIMIRQASDARNRRAYLDAGYDWQQDQNNILAWLSFHDRTWVRTPMQTFLSMPFQRLLPGGGMTQDLAFTKTVAREARRLMPDAVLGVNNAEPVSYGPNPPSIYTLIGSYGGPRRDQTRTWGRLGDNDAESAQNLRTTVNRAIAKEVWSLELPSGYPKAIARGEFDGFDRRFAANR